MCKTTHASIKDQNTNIMFLCMMWFWFLCFTSIQGQTASTSVGNVPEDGKVTILEHLRFWRSGHSFNQHHHIKIAHGVVNIIGWGIILPIGVIIARYWREVQENWYWLHTVCQMSGFILGTIGWGLGMALRNSAKRHTLTTHGVLSTIILAFTSLQVLAICVQPKGENVWRKCWVIYHRLLGYTSIVLIIANIFEGTANQNSANKWRWFYIAILGVLASIPISLELLRCFKFFKQINKGVKFNS